MNDSAIVERYTLPAPSDTALDAAPDSKLGERDLSRLRWRTRRGLLENDLFIQQFFARFEHQLTVRHANGLYALMDLGDNDLLDLHLNRKTLAQVQPALDTPDIRLVLNLLKAKAEK